MTTEWLPLEPPDAFLLAAALLFIIEPEDLTVEQRLHSAARTLRAKEYCNAERYGRLMRRLHWIAYGKELPPMPPGVG